MNNMAWGVHSQDSICPRTGEVRVIPAAMGHGPAWGILSAWSNRNLAASQERCSTAPHLRLTRQQLLIAVDADFSFKSLGVGAPGPGLGPSGLNDTVNLAAVRERDPGSRQPDVAPDRERARGLARHGRAQRAGAVGSHGHWRYGHRRVRAHLGSLGRRVEGVPGATCSLNHTSVYRW